MSMDDLFPKHSQASEREIHFALLGGTKLWTSRLALHGWTRYQDNRCRWMISFQNTVKRESERERELHSHFLYYEIPSSWMNGIWWHLLLMDDLFPKHKSEWSSRCTFGEWKYVLADDLFMDEWNCFDGWSLYSRNETPYIVVTHGRKIGYCRG